jgi:hypothetical protein
MYVASITFATDPEGPRGKLGSTRCSVDSVCEHFWFDDCWLAIPHDREVLRSRCSEHCFLLAVIFTRRFVSVLCFTVCNQLTSPTTVYSLVFVSCRAQKQAASMALLNSLTDYFANKDAIPPDLATTVADIPHSRIRKAVIRRWLQEKPPPDSSSSNLMLPDFLLLLKMEFVSEHEIDTFCDSVLSSTSCTVETETVERVYVAQIMPLLSTRRKHIWDKYKGLLVALDEFASQFQPDLQDTVVSLFQPPSKLYVDVEVEVSERVVSYFRNKLPVPSQLPTSSSELIQFVKADPDLCVQPQSCVMRLLHCDCKEYAEIVHQLMKGTQNLLKPILILQLPPM